jgi:hypothetical protein
MNEHTSSTKQLVSRMCVREKIDEDTTILHYTFLTNCFVPIYIIIKNILSIVTRFDFTRATA